MKHLQLPLVDAYLIVRSRRLSVLIQPNMRLLFNLIGWEVQVAKERAAVVDGVTMSDNSHRVPLLSRQEEVAVKALERSLSWPFLAREVHRLNAKYIR
jgi:dual specificity MAP kinase phosphatase